MAFCNLNINRTCTFDGRVVFGGPCPPDGHNGGYAIRRNCVATRKHALQLLESIRHGYFFPWIRYSCTSPTTTFQPVATQSILIDTAMLLKDLQITRHFPSRASEDKLTRKSEPLEVYCHCRLPEEGNMIRCQEWIINPRRACAARVTVLGLCVCLSVCVSVCLMPYFSEMVSLHVERNVPMASTRHCADYNNNNNNKF